MVRDNTFGDYKFDDWVCEKVRDQIRDFWGCFGRTYKDWLASANAPYRDNQPKYGQMVVILRKNGWFKGRYIHAWNNIGRLISDDGKCEFVSSCDTFYDKAPTTEIYSIN